MNRGRRRVAQSGLSLAGTLALASAALPLAGCGTPALKVPVPATAAQPPRVRNGDRWRYGLTNLYNRLPVGTLTATVIETRPATRIGLVWSDGNRPPAEEIYFEPWNIVQDPNWDREMVFATPQPLTPRDLIRPSTQSTATQFRVPGDSGQFGWTQTLFARGWERVEVPAGAFDCLRVERRIAFQHPDLLRLRSERSDTLWYAPAVSRWVQRESTGIFWRSSLRYGGVREDWVLAQLLDYTPAPQS
jgi:hypothetical protein